MNHHASLVTAGVVLLAALAPGARAADAPQSPAAASIPASVIHRTILNCVDVPGSSYEVVYALVEIAANSVVPRHTHPGTVMGYLLEGDYTVMINGQPPHAMAVGETFTVPPGVAHEEHSGAHAAKILAVFTVEKGKPLSAPAP
jgi:quercetin dioxygenase-like cupin family protein